MLRLPPTSGRTPVGWLVRLGVAAPFAGCRIERAGKFPFGGAGHHDMIVFAPLDPERAARNIDGDRAPGAARACCRDGGGAGGGDAGAGEARTALPGAQVNRLWRGDMGTRDLGAFGQDRMMFQTRPE